MPPKLSMWALQRLDPYAATKYESLDETWCTETTQSDMIYYKAFNVGSSTSTIMVKKIVGTPDAVYYPHAYQ